MGGESGHVEKLTREQILTLYKAGPEAIVSLIEYLQDRQSDIYRRLRDLEEQLQKNSRNSHKPPSSDGLKKIAKVRKPSGKKPGGQPGHEGNTLRLVDSPDTVTVHKVERCQHCGEWLTKKKALTYDRRHVFDLPAIQVQVSEHRAEIKDCERCGKLSTAEFPQDVRHKVQYGPRLKANAAYIKNYGLCRLPDYAACAVSNSLWSEYFVLLLLLARHNRGGLLVLAIGPGKERPPCR